MSILKSIKNWLGRIHDKIEWLLPELLLLTRKAKIRRIAILEERRASKIRPKKSTSLNLNPRNSL